MFRQFCDDDELETELSSLFCSEFVAQALQQYGVLNVSNEDLGLFQPRDLSSLPKAGRPVGLTVIPEAVYSGM